MWFYHCLFFPPLTSLVSLNRTSRNSNPNSEVWKEALRCWTSYCWLRRECGSLSATRCISFSSKCTDKLVTQVMFKPLSRLPHRTWDPTSSRPAHQPTTLTARPCPSARAPSRRAPTWRGSWTPSKTVSSEMVVFPLTVMTRNKTENSSANSILFCNKLHPLV